MDLFKGLTVGDLWPNKRDIIYLADKQKVSECLEILDNARILSAPVKDEKGELLGIVDVLDIALFVIGLFPKEVPFENLSEEEFNKVVLTGERFENAEIGHVLEFSHAIKSDYEHVFVVEKSTPIEKLLEYFFQGVHRVIVVGEDETTPINIVSQSDLLSILTQSLPFLDETRTIEDLKLIRASGHGELQTVSVKTKTIQLLMKMQPDTKKPLFSAIPVISDEGKLVSNFSASDLKGLRKGNFVSLLLPATEYLSLQRGGENFLSILEKRKSLRPLHCSRFTNFETLVTKMTAHRIHRIWIVEDEKPIGVVSIGDLFKVFLPWASQV